MLNSRLFIPLLKFKSTTGTKVNFTKPDDVNYK
jgi:hypothetical protein